MTAVRAPLARLLSQMWAVGHGEHRAAVLADVADQLRAIERDGCEKAILPWLLMLSTVLAAEPVDDAQLAFVLDGLRVAVELDRAVAKGHE